MFVWWLTAPHKFPWKKKSKKAIRLAVAPPPPIPHLVNNNGCLLTLSLVFLFVVWQIEGLLLFARVARTVNITLSLYSCSSFNASRKTWSQKFVLQHTVYHKPMPIWRKSDPWPQDQNLFSSCYAAIFTRQSSRAVTLAPATLFRNRAYAIIFLGEKRKGIGQ